MPTNIINEIINKLEDNFAIEIIFDKNSQISNYVESKIFSKKIKKTHPQNIIELSALIEKIEFGIFIDSGPLHLAKILAKKGLLITTSIDSNHLLNKFETIKVFNTYYKSSYCTSPCGLTNLINYKKKIGCYDSLKINFNNISNLDNYNSLQRGNLKDKYINFVINPVGCIKKIDINALLKSIMENTL